MATTDTQAAIVIDRPKGTKRIFDCPSGPVEVIYPLDYGNFRGLINPEDGEAPDVFVGTAAPDAEEALHGQMLKGKVDKFASPGGSELVLAWQMDETKWFTDCTTQDVKRLFAWWNTQDPYGFPVAYPDRIYRTRTLLWVRVMEHCRVAYDTHAVDIAIDSRICPTCHAWLGRCAR